MEITDLPLELHQLILEFLLLPDVINLRLVNKFFCEVVRQYRIYELGFQYFKKGLCLFFDQYAELVPIRSFSPTNLILYRRQHLLKRPLFKVETLRKLQVVCSNEPAPNLDDSHLNRLIHLEELRVRIAGLPILSNRGQPLNWKLSLPNLKMFKLNYFSVDVGRIYVDAPRLHSLTLLRTKAGDGLHFEHPLSVKRLTLTELDKMKFPFEIFENVEELTIHEPENKDTLSTVFPRLKTLRIKRNPSRGHLTQRELDQLLSGRDLQVIFRGVRLENCLKGTKLDSSFAKLPKHSFCEFFKKPQYEACFDFLLEQHRQPIDRTEADLSVLLGVGRRIDFEWLNNPEKWPVDLILNKFSLLREITVNEPIICPDRFMQVLAGCKMLSKLYLQNARLPQRFFDQLPSITSLWELEIDDQHKQSDIKCFRFLSRMFRLKFLYLDRLLYAIQRGDLDLTRFNWIVFQHDERGDFLGGFVCRDEVSENLRMITVSGPRCIPDVYYLLHMCEAKDQKTSLFPQFSKTILPPSKKMNNQQFLEYYANFRKAYSGMFKGCNIL